MSDNVKKMLKTKIVSRNGKLVEVPVMKIKPKTSPQRKTPSKASKSL